MGAIALQVLWLPDTITKIENGSFSSKNIHTIFFEGTEEQWAAIDLGKYETLWADVEIIFVPNGVDSNTVMAKCIDYTPN